MLEFYGMVQKLNYACYANWGIAGGVLMILLHLRLHFRPIRARRRVPRA